MLGSRLKSRRMALTAGIVIVLGLAVFVPLRIAATNGQSPLSLEEAGQQVLQAYEGKIASAEKGDGEYIVRLQSDTGLYELNVAADGSGITAIQRLDEGNGAGPKPSEEASPGPEQPLESDEPTNTETPRETDEPAESAPQPNPPESSPEPSPSAAPKPSSPGQSTGPSAEPSAGPSAPNGSAQPAVRIGEQKAIDAAKGKVKGTVTDVDLEQVRGKWFYYVEIETYDGKEAVVQINAASGAVVSVTWDDDDDEEDDD